MWCVIRSLSREKSLLEASGSRCRSGRRETPAFSWPAAMLKPSQSLTSCITVHRFCLVRIPITPHALRPPKRSAFDRAAGHVLLQSCSTGQAWKRQPPASRHREPCQSPLKPLKTIPLRITPNYHPGFTKSQRNLVVHNTFTPINMTGWCEPWQGALRSLQRRSIRCPWNLICACPGG